MNIPKIFLAATLLTAVAWLPLEAAPVDATVSSTTGDAEVAAPGSAHYTALKVGQAVPIGSTIRTGDDGVVILVTTPGSSVRIDNDTILKINDLGYAKDGDTVTERKADLDLKTGGVAALIDPSTPKITKFNIQTPQGGAAARGTFYAVVVDHGKAYVGVKEGKVAVINSSK
jgi:hypothetical protein